MTGQHCAMLREYRRPQGGFSALGYKLFKAQADLGHLCSRPHDGYPGAFSAERCKRPSVGLKSGSTVLRSSLGVRLT